MHNKDFKRWNSRKIEINSITKLPFFKEREIWMCSIGINVGYEQDGGIGFMRPIIILKKFNNKVLWSVPVTNINKNNIYHFDFYIVGKRNSAILSQLRLIDAKRLDYKIGVLNKEDFYSIKEKIKGLLP